MGSVDHENAQGFLSALTALAGVTAMSGDTQASSNSSAAFATVPAQHWVPLGAGPDQGRDTAHVGSEGRAVGRAPG